MLNKMPVQLYLYEQDLKYISVYSYWGNIIENQQQKK